MFLTTEEVLEYLQINLRTVYRLIKAGKIPAVRVGRQWRFRKGDIDAWLDSQGTAPGGPAPAGGPRTHGPAARARRGRRSEHPRPAHEDARPRRIRRRDGGRWQRRPWLLRESNYDLLIADLSMPGMDGLTLIRQVRHLRSDLPIIIITGFSSESSAIEAVNLDVTSYLLKPFGVPDVLAAARKALGAAVA